MKFPRPVSSALRFYFTAACLSAIALHTVRADVVIDWNVAMTHYSETLPPPGMPPFIEARVYAMAHIAELDAVTNAKGHGNASAAAAQAAHDVLVNQFPGGTSGFDALLTTQLAAIPAGTDKTKGIQLGAVAAAKILSARANDGAATAEGPYTPGTKPGDYQFTPPFDGPPFNGYAAVPNWGKVVPFAMKSGSQFRVPPPYKVTDLAYTFDLNEIKALGSLTSDDRTDDQTDLALFWYENSSFAWNRIARILAAQRSDSLLEHAQMFATLNAAMADATIAAIESKYTYNFWRPITAIRQAATDGNDLTTADPTWQPLNLTPPVPDYPSNHAAMGGAAAVVLAAFFGNDVTFTVQSTMSLPFPQIQPRTFNHLSDAAKENAISRMLVGIHFRHACIVGLQQGREVGYWVIKHGPAAAECH